MTAEQGAGAHWHLGDEDWLQEKQSFRLLAVGGVELPALLTDLDYLVGARATAGEHAFFPKQFNYSPFDGRHLAATTSLNWLPPCSASTGQRVSDGPAGDSLETLLLRLDQAWTGGITMQSSAERIPPPASSGLTFFSADAGGYRSALFALGRSGALWLRQRGGSQWIALRASSAPLARHAFEPWAMALAVLPGKIGHDIVLANEEGADVLRVDPLLQSYAVDRLPGRALGAPGRLDDFALIPQQADGILRIAVRSAGGWSHIPVEAADARHAESLLAAPVTSINGHSLAWIGQHGWLQVGRDGKGLSARWIAWPDGREARGVLGPPYRTGEGDWQLLQDASNHWYATLMDARMPQEHRAPRASVCTGQRAFQLDVQVDRPWNRYDEEQHHGPKHVLHPFLETRQRHLLLSVRVPDQRKALMSFYENTQPQHVEYCIQLGGPPHVYALDTARPWDAQWFLHDDALWLWVDERGSLVRWSAP